MKNLNFIFSFLSQMSIFGQRRRSMVLVHEASLPTVDVRRLVV